MPTAITPCTTELIDVARSRLAHLDHELDALFVRTDALAAQTRWRSKAFALFAEQAAGLVAELRRIDAEAQDLRQDLLRARAMTTLEPSALRGAFL